MRGPSSNPDAYLNVLKLRVVRQFQDKPISDPHLHAILEAGRWTGTSKNRQAWSIVVITDPEQKSRIATCGDFTDPIRRSSSGDSSRARARGLRVRHWPTGPELDAGGQAPRRRLLPNNLPPLRGRGSGAWSWGRRPLSLWDCPGLSAGRPRAGPARRPQTPRRIRSLEQVLNPARPRGPSRKFKSGAQSGSSL